jgi:hypothetical protein
MTVTNPPILARQDYNKSFLIKCDALSEGIRVVLV